MRPGQQIATTPSRLSPGSTISPYGRALRSFRHQLRSLFPYRLLDDYLTQLLKRVVEFHIRRDAFSQRRRDGAVDDFQQPASCEGIDDRDERLHYGGMGNRIPSTRYERFESCTSSRTLVKHSFAVLCIKRGLPRYATGFCFVAGTSFVSSRAFEDLERELERELHYAGVKCAGNLTEVRRRISKLEARGASCQAGWRDTGTKAIGHVESLYTKL